MNSKTKIKYWLLKILLTLSANDLHSLTTDLYARKVVYVALKMMHNLIWLEAVSQPQKRLISSFAELSFDPIYIVIWLHIGETTLDLHDRLF
jgi:hypothetical protein